MADTTQIMLGLITFAGLAVGALVNWLSKKSDKATQSLDLALRTLGERVAEQDTKITRLTERLDESEKGRREQAVQIRDLQDRERDREELLADYRAHTLAWELYTESGSVPPQPAYSWRVRADLEQAKKEAEL